MENKFSKYFTGFRKNLNTQNSLLLKTFDSLNCDLLLAKLEAYDFDNNAVTFVRSYLTNRLQCCKINNSFSEWAKISAGVP